MNEIYNGMTQEELDEFNADAVFGGKIQIIDGVRTLCVDDSEISPNNQSFVQTGFSPINDHGLDQFQSLSQYEDKDISPIPREDTTEMMYDIKTPGPGDDQVDDNLIIEDDLSDAELRIVTPTINHNAPADFEPIVIIKKKVPIMILPEKTQTMKLSVPPKTGTFAVRKSVPIKPVFPQKKIVKQPIAIVVPIQPVQTKNIKKLGTVYAPKLAAKKKTPVKASFRPIKKRERISLSDYTAPPKKTTPRRLTPVKKRARVSLTTHVTHVEDTDRKDIGDFMPAEIVDDDEEFATDSDSEDAESDDEGEIAPVPVVRKKRVYKKKLNAIDRVTEEQLKYDHVIGRKPMVAIIKDLLRDYGDYRCDREAVDAIRCASEQFLVELFENANRFAIHRKKVSVNCDDIVLTQELNDRIKLITRNVV